MLARYWAHVTAYYVKNGRPTSEQHVVRMALRFVRKLSGGTPAVEFSPKKVFTVREAMVAHEITRPVTAVDPVTGTPTTIRKVLRIGLARSCVNKLLGRIRRMFAWAVEQELLPVAVHAARLRVPGLRRGKSAARETPKVRPVPAADVDATLPHLPPAVAAMAACSGCAGVGRSWWCRSARATWTAPARCGSTAHPATRPNTTTTTATRTATASSP